jgi:murein DD-endopeptidase MepM/ murein hydrolase activator NlpD
MLLCPIQNAGTFDYKWIQVRPYVTQMFGKNPDIYKQFGLKGHNGIDFRAKVGTPLYASCDGTIKIGNDGAGGYGKYVRIFKDNLELVYGHLSKILVEDGQKVYMGDKIALSGNTGFSTGPHLHFGLRFRDEKGKITNYLNGYLGYTDPATYLICWKGTILKSNL